jgi:3alpha(or 20beta)-hydroxysteroid dehydrogenase
MKLASLTDRAIAVTGAARGMGAAIARTLIGRGANVVATDVLEPQDSLDGAQFIRLDVTSETGWDNVIKAIIDQFGRLDGLVNNAGIAEHGLLVETSVDLFASCVAMRGVDNQFAYAASKWAIRGMTKCAAIELGPQGIRVNAVNPGPTRTPMIAGFPDDVLNSLQSMTPMGRLGEPNDMASAVAFLLSDEASFISGAEVEVDGGLFA